MFGHCKALQGIAGILEDNWWLGAAGTSPTPRGLSTNFLGATNLRLELPNAVGDEHLLLTEAGVQTCRTVRRLPQSSQCDPAILEKAKGVPWNRFLGIATNKVVQEKSEQKATTVPELESAETYSFGASAEKEVVAVPMPPMPAKAGKREKRR